MSTDENHTETENSVSNSDENKPWQFQRGISGNPSGKPKGTLHRATQATMLLLEGEAEALTRKAVELALEGNTAALKLCLERIAPALKATSPSIKLDIPEPGNLADTARAFIAAAANGNLAPDIAAQLVSAVASVARVEEMEQFKHRLESLERAIKEQVR